MDKAYDLLSKESKGETRGVCRF